MICDLTLCQCIPFFAVTKIVFKNYTWMARHRVTFKTLPKKTKIKSKFIAESRKNTESVQSWCSRINNFELAFSCVVFAVQFMQVWQERYKHIQLSTLLLVGLRWLVSANHRIAFSWILLQRKPLISQNNLRSPTGHKVNCEWFFRLFLRVCVFVCLVLQTPTCLAL